MWTRTSPFSTVANRPMRDTIIVCGRAQRPALGVFEQLGHSLTFSPPSLIAEHVPIERLLQPGTLPWEFALLVEVNFGLKSRQFICHLLMLMPEESIERMKRALDRFLANL